MGGGLALTQTYREADTEQYRRFYVIQDVQRSTIGALDTASVLQFKPGLLVDEAYCDEALQRLDEALLGRK